ncbi:MAG: Unknown protein [uncultured Sulfurovum sp.]|uniref:HTH cro/C1-type domain-containing protein n=1 Tax=uncultured Sulfurovum sp. TaxID=269237 RepID=A0A6S6TTJ3_9BACT|nr:MAG: Unknown protein [uncultured Sulfurovum sp.]
MSISTIDKIIEIYERSELSMSKFAKILQKDRRTISSWIYKEINVTPKQETLKRISLFFRYPNEIWDEQCEKEEFFEMITTLPSKDVKIIEANREGRLKYILKNEDEQRLVIHPKFPASVYRDVITPQFYLQKENNKVKELKQKRIDKMLNYAYKSDEWHDIRSLLNFCFSEIGNRYTQEEKIATLELVVHTIHENYNKRLYLFDSFSKKIYGLDAMYTSVDIKNNIMFFKSPLESIFIEIRNKEIVEKIHRHFTLAKESPMHVKPSDAEKILQILISILKQNKTLIDAYTEINLQTSYGTLFKNNLSLSIQERL